MIVMGKGDHFIAGYNTASKQEKSRYNVKKLRIMISCPIFLFALLMILHIITINHDSTYIGIIFLVVTLSSAGLITANKFSKKE